MRCHCKTTTGERCKFNAKEGSRFCGKHEKKCERTPASHKRLRSEEEGDIPDPKREQLVGKELYISEVEQAFGPDVAVMASELTNDNASREDIREVINEIAEQLNVSLEDLRRKIEELFERKEVSPRRGKHKCRNPRSYYDLDTIMYLVDDKDLVVDSSNICYKADEILGQFRADNAIDGGSGAYRRSTNPEGILYSELGAKYARGDAISSDENLRDVVSRMYVADSAVSSPSIDSSPAPAAPLALGIYGADARRFPGLGMDDDDESDNAVLMREIVDGNIEAVGDLLSRMTAEELESTNESGDTALHVAAETGDYDIFRLIITRIPREMLIMRNEAGNTALHVAVQYGHIRIMEILLSIMRPEDMAIRNYAEETALHVAARASNGRIISRLALRMRVADRAIRNSEGYTALHIAAEQPQGLSSVSELTRRMPEEQLGLRAGYNGETALHIAVITNGQQSVDVVDVLLENMRDIDIEAEDIEGRTALHYAAENGNTEMVLLLLRHMRDESISIADNAGDTAVDLALASDARGASVGLGELIRNHFIIS